MQYKMCSAVFMFSMSNSVLSSISTHVLDINASVDQTKFVFCLYFFESTNGSFIYLVCV